MTIPKSRTGDLTMQLFSHLAVVTGIDTRGEAAWKCVHVHTHVPVHMQVNLLTPERGLRIAPGSGP